jgi:hypothetical protein
MNDLVPCPSCRRHVRKHEPACPFCATELSLAQLPSPVLPRSRLGRAATFTFGATLAGAALMACGAESEEGKKGGSGGSAGGVATAGSAMGGNIAQPYGVPPFGGAGFGNFAGNGGQTNAGAGGQSGSGAGGQSGSGNGGQGGSGNGGQGGSGNGGQGGSGAGGQSGSGNGGQGGVAPPYGIPPADSSGPVYGAAPSD